jgi:hypothetical protein
MKRRSGAPMRLISQQSSANPAVTLFKLENSDGDSDPGPSSTTLRHSKRVKVEAVVKVEDVVHGDGDHGGVFRLIYQGSTHSGQKQESKVGSNTVAIATEAQSY